MTLAKSLQRFVPQELKVLAQQTTFATGPSGYDPWGFHLDEALLGLAASKWLYTHYFRVQTQGIENVPASGRCLIIANHSGQVYPIDAMMTATSLALRANSPRSIRAMVERFFPTTPYLGDLVFRMGMTLGDPINCRRLLRREEAILVFPEGERGFIKKPSQKYKLQRMGNGFVRMAIENNTPIIPLGIVGCEEITPNFGREETLAKKLGLPAIPLSPPIALPAKIRLHFGAPITFPDGSYSEQEYDQMVNEVRTQIEHLIHEGLQKRGSIF